MAVQIAAADRGPIGADNPLSPGAAAEQRANAFSTYLAYYGTYEVEAHRVIHDVHTTLFPHWSGQRQIRDFAMDGDALTLIRTTGDAKIELVWVRAGSTPTAPMQ